MIGEIRTREPAAGGFHIERQHPAVPSLIFLHEILENIGPACLHVGSFKRVVDDVEQEAVTENFEIFPVATSAGRSEEHTSELQSLMRISYAVFCLKKKKQQYKIYN